jgi:hypothetical protein
VLLPTLICVLTTQSQPLQWSDRIITPLHTKCWMFYFHPWKLYCNLMNEIPCINKLMWIVNDWGAGNRVECCARRCHQPPLISRLCGCVPPKVSPKVNLHQEPNTLGTPHLLHPTPLGWANLGVNGALASSLMGVPISRCSKCRGPSVLWFCFQVQNWHLLNKIVAATTRFLVDMKK